MWNYSFDVLRMGEDLRGSADGVMGLTADWVGLDGKEKKNRHNLHSVGSRKKASFFQRIHDEKGVRLTGWHEAAVLPKKQVSTQRLDRSFITGTVCLYVKCLV